MSRLDDLKLIAAKSKKPLAWYGLAMEFRSAGDVDNALLTFEKVHSIDARYAERTPRFIPHMRAGRLG